MSAPEGYLALARAHEHEVEIKRSRFLTFLLPVTSEPAARDAIAAVRAAHPLARHHCTAFVIASRGPNSPSLARSNDDGEPSGTAGAPMLEALGAYEGQGVADALAVVVRYFGGVLLGAGGLTRAYRGAVADALAQAPLVRRAPRDVLGVSLDYQAAHALEVEAARAGWGLEREYGARVEVSLAVPTREAEVARARIAALTAGAAVPAARGTRWVDLPAT